MDMNDFEAKGHRKIFVGGISWDTTDAGFTSFFSRFGEIKDAIVMRDRLTGASRGFGFVTFADPSSVEKVLAKELKLDGRVVDCKIAIPRGQVSGKRTHRTKKIFVGGLSSKTTVEEFKEHFQQYGTVTDAVIMIDHDSGRSRGFGFVTFDSEETVEDVMGKTHSISDKQVECKKALPKAKMLEQKAEQRGGTGQVVYGTYGTYGGNVYGSGGTGYTYDAYYRAALTPSYGTYGTYPDNTYTTQRSRSLGSTTFAGYRTPYAAYAPASPSYDSQDQEPLIDYANTYSTPAYTTGPSYELYGTSQYIQTSSTHSPYGSLRVPTSYTVYAPTDDGVTVM